MTARDIPANPFGRVPAALGPTGSNTPLDRTVTPAHLTPRVRDLGQGIERDFGAPRSIIRPR